MTITPLKKPKKQKSRSVSEQTLWTNFSKFIRARDADWQGYCRCISCSTVKKWREMQAGHYIPQGSDQALKYNEMNVNAQCVSCNMHKSGNLIPYRMGLVNKYGSKKVEQLEQSHFIKKTRSRLSQIEIDSLNSHYKKELKKLQSEKAL